MSWGEDVDWLRVIVPVITMTMIVYNKVLFIMNTILFTNASLKCKLQSLKMRRNEIIFPSSSVGQKD